jgi:hypothetical protein
LNSPIFDDLKSVNPRLQIPSNGGLPFSAILRGA